jgi:hypothetical protein
MEKVKSPLSHILKPFTGITWRFAHACSAIMSVATAKAAGGGNRDCLFSSKG